MIMVQACDKGLSKQKKSGFRENADTEAIEATDSRLEQINVVGKTSRVPHQKAWTPSSRTGQRTCCSHDQICGHVSCLFNHCLALKSFEGQQLHFRRSTMLEMPPSTVLPKLAIIHMVFACAITCSTSCDDSKPTSKGLSQHWRSVLALRKLLRLPSTHTGLGRMPKVAGAYHPSTSSLQHQRGQSTTEVGVAQIHTRELRKYPSLNNYRTPSRSEIDPSLSREHALWL
jgi:hypothetical protein